MKLRDYQLPAVEALVENPFLGLFADVGAGKTLMVIEALKRVGGRTLVICPLRAAKVVWPNEVDKWSDMTVATVHGTPKKRAEIMDSGADLFVINPEGIQWLFDNYDLRESGITNLVIDESHLFKNPSSKRFKTLRKNITQFKRRWIMTATPATRNCLDLWSQLFIVDKGRSLGENVTRFRARYAYKGGYMGRIWLPQHDAADRITEDSRDIVHRVEVDIEDNTLFNDIVVQLPPSALKTYKLAEKQLRIELEDSEKVTESAVAAYILMRQISNGSFYDDDGNVQRSHGEKSAAVKELHESLQGGSVLVFYQFRHDLLSLLDVFPDAECINGDTKAHETAGIVSRFGSGKTSVLLAQPASAGTGLDGLQHNCSNIVWYGLPDDLSLYLQGNGRIAGHRANGKIVTISHIISERTVDEVIADRLQSKDTSQLSILSAYRR